MLGIERCFFFEKNLHKRQVDDENVLIFTLLLLIISGFRKHIQKSLNILRIDFQHKTLQDCETAITICETWSQSRSMVVVIVVVIVIVMVLAMAIVLIKAVLKSSLFSHFELALT